MKVENQGRRLSPKYNEEDHPSANKSQEDDSRQTYTALVFNQNDKERSYCQNRGRYSKYVQGSALKDKNQSMSELLKINSISKLTSSKQVKDSAAIFANVKLNMSVDKKSKKVNKRPASAFTKISKQRYQNINFDNAKELGNRMSRELSLSGKNCFEEPAIKIRTKEDEDQENFGQFQQKFNENAQSYGYIAKSRLISSKQPKKSQYIVQQKELTKKSMHFDSAISFQSLYNNLLINSKAVENKRPAKQRNSQHHFNKTHKFSFHGALKNQQNTDGSHSMANAFIVASRQRKTICSNACKEQLGYLSSGSFHKSHSKTLVTSQILKSMKKGKGKISRILRLKKQEIIEPQLVIENIQICKTEKKKGQKPLKKSLAENHCNISQYLSNLSAYIPTYNQGKRQQNCQLQVGCKQVTYS